LEEHLLDFRVLTFSHRDGRAIFSSACPKCFTRMVKPSIGLVPARPSDWYIWSFTAGASSPLFFSVGFGLCLPLSLCPVFGLRPASPYRFWKHEKVIRLTVFFSSHTGMILTPVHPARSFSALDLRFFAPLLRLFIYERSFGSSEGRLLFDLPCQSGPWVRVF